MAHFDADAVECDDEVTVTFRLNGREWSCRNRDVIDARIAAALIGNVAMSISISDLFAGILVPEDVEEFTALLASPEFPLPLRKTRGLLEFLTAQILNRPTVRPSSSGDGPRSTEATSGGGSPSAGTRRRRSAS
jgi:hypothetical protein